MDLLDVPSLDFFFSISGKDRGGGLGISVSYAGDVNNDGNDDVIVGAYLATPSGRTKSGKVHITQSLNITYSIRCESPLLYYNKDLDKCVQKCWPPYSPDYQKPYRACMTISQDEIDQVDTILDTTEHTKGLVNHGLLITTFISISDPSRIFFDTMTK